MIPIRVYLYAALIVMLACGGWYLHHKGYEQGMAYQSLEVYKQANKDAAAALAAQQAYDAKVSAIAQQYEKDKTDAQAKADRTIADLRTGNLRLQKRWICPRVLAPTVTASPGEPDAGTTDRDASIARIIRAAADADSQIRRLQEVLKAERQ